MSQHTGILLLQTAVSIAGAAFAGVTFGTSLIAADQGQPAARPQVLVPLGMKRLLDPVLGLPFRLGARDPQEGALDCLGLVLFAYREGLGLHLRETAEGGNIEPHPEFPCIWNSRSDPPGSWLRVAQAWDMVCWADQLANQILQGEVPGVTLFLHVGLMLNRGAILSSAIRGGVGFRYSEEIDATVGENVLALFRPTDISNWEPVRADLRVI